MFPGKSAPPPKISSSEETESPVMSPRQELDTGKSSVKISSSGETEGPCVEHFLHIPPQIISVLPEEEGGQGDPFYLSRARQPVVGD